MVLFRAIPPKSNLSRKESLALKTLRDNKDIMILPADKGNATVLMKKEDYHQKILDVLADDAYRAMPCDTTDAISRKTTELIKKSGILEEELRNVRPKAPAPPRIYGLPKIHKTGVPLRPIVSAIGAPTYNLAKYLSGVLAPFVGRCEHHVKNSMEFVKTLQDIHVQSTDIMVSLDVVSLFTRVPLIDTLALLGRILDPRTVELFRYVLTSSYFLYNGDFYEQTDGVAMGSPLSPVIANFFMEDFEEHALNSAPLRPKCFFRYVDDTFIIWPHGMDTLHSFVDHMNSRHPNIRFTMETETNGELPFLDILIRRRGNGTLGHKVYRKPTHTDLYLNGKSHHHPSQKNAVLCSLIHRAKRISDKDNLKGELKHLKKTFIDNGYSHFQVQKAHKRAFRPDKEDGPDEERPPASKAILPYVSTVSGTISRILSKHHIRTIHLPPGKLRDQLVRAKDPIGLKTAGIYRIPCECGKVYIGETERTIETRVKEHRRHLRLGQFEKSAIAEHCAQENHNIHWEETAQLGRTRGYWDRITKEAIEIRLHPNNINRDRGLQLSSAWNPAINRTRKEEKSRTNQRPPR